MSEIKLIPAPKKVERPVDYDSLSKHIMSEIATATGVSYELLSADFERVDRSHYREAYLRAKNFERRFYELWFQEQFGTPAS